jgi:quercetin 2,3-dioxygenase
MLPNLWAFGTMLERPGPADQLHLSKPTWWLESLFHFSFADWYTTDKSRHNFGALRVVNDDLVKPRAGFGCAAPA